MIKVNRDGSFQAETVEEALALSHKLEEQAFKLEENAMRALAVNSVPTNGHVPTEDPVETLLRAGGYRQIKAPVRAIYATMLRKPQKIWDAHAIAKETQREPKTVTAILGHMVKRNIIERVALGAFKVR